MMTIAGQPFLTDFQTQQLISQFQQKTKLNVSQISTQQVYVLSRELSGEEHKKSLDLFGIKEAIALTTPQDNQLQVIVAPRFGTISPWASKATDIFNNCEIKINRVERVVVYTLTLDEKTDGDAGEKLPADAEQLLFDRMTQSLVYDLSDVSKLFDDQAPASLNHIDVIGQGQSALESANTEFGFALSSEDIDYLMNAYVNELGRNPTDVELMMFAQANSEHCRHKIFNAQWTVDGEVQPKSLFQMIKNTYQSNPQGILSAYKDNAAVMAGSDGMRFYPIPTDAMDANSIHPYGFHQEDIDILMKVETHNHPTAIAPYSGAATGSGGEIRDEGATGRGGKPKAGLAGFHVSHLHIPELSEKWEQSGQLSTQAYGTPDRMATSLEIMLDAPLGSANFSNEFGRPNLCGYFRSFQLDTSAAKDGSEMRGYHKPIMLAGGYGNIKRNLIEKNAIKKGDLLIVLGGPAMQIGLGGGAASSVDSGELDEGLDFASVQRDNAEMERRCQEVIDRCWALAGNDADVSIASQDGNPIVSIHDVGAGGLSNAMPELVNDHEMGAHLNLRKIPSLEAGMSPMAIWSNEAQERYVLAIRPESKDQFDAICARERCPYAILGEATDIRQLIVDDELLDEQPVDMPMQVLLGGTPKMQRSFERTDSTLPALELGEVNLAESITYVLRHPTVASKSFLISIGDRSITGMVVRDQYVGRYQVPVSDCAVTASGLVALDGQPMTGEAMSVGERTPVALINPKASARLAVGEAITNIAGARIAQLSDITMSANWMAACGDDAEDAALFDAVHAIGEELCPALGIAIPVGKDSLSMRANWTDEEGADKSVVSPMSLVVTAFAPVVDVAKTLTPELINGDSAFYRIDLSKGKLRLGGSILAQTLSQLGNDCPDLAQPSDLIDFFNFVQAGNAQGVISAYHDIGDGGLLATIAEMQFTSRQGIKLSLDDDNLLGQLFSEELGAVIQVLPENVAALMQLAEEFNVSDMLSLVGQSTEEDSLIIQTPLHQGDKTLRFSRSELQQQWSQVSYQIARRRDNPACVQQEYDLISDASHKGLIAAPNFDLNQKVEAPYVNSRADANNSQPRVAILREQGVNGQTEMAAGFTQAGFEAVDVHMSDLLSGRINLRDFDGLVACGGFSYGDVLGAGSGWANSILFHDELRMQFVRFFARPNTFSLGVCNGCQMMAQLKDLIPGAENFPRFIANESARFEARTVNVKVERTKSILFKGMQDSILPIAVAHGEGLATLNATEIDGMAKHGQLAMRYVDSQGHPTETYPLNPNGSVGGVTGLCSTDGRVTIMMPHPERNLKAYNHSWKPEQWDEDGAWMRMFRNARAWLR
ncbi:phosphoribosylformylglycinamidine synthase [Psychrobacter pacificensis]|uniref:Phosphoribosylformylglycinamidine synthase n=1 Tax=Psychrobacter pacificensis TaxID=112002 RepID=A0A1G6U4K5_9GAMM|nr:phosphoribosylformylglycinamidine synthase [Psychrobacter pacificensis]GLR30401.1 phosphoribosylformylglycinamidine synthase [Psychrobacter pacificensis]SDD35475.1 phosphoribosylformylglycinamidine synthase [Psychrobacter pacificensis]